MEIGALIFATDYCIRMDELARALEELGGAAYVGRPLTIVTAALRSRITESSSAPAAPR